MRHVEAEVLKIVLCNVCKSCEYDTQTISRMQMLALCYIPTSAWRTIGQLAKCITGVAILCC